MYEHLEALRSEVKGMLSKLSPWSDAEVANAIRAFPECPVEYVTFMRERGYGALTDRGEHFVFERRLLSAVSEYFQDAQIFEHGAKGDVWVFGWENMGTAYGFDSGMQWQIVEIDEYRLVTPLKLSFRRFVEGLFVCYPQIPVAYVNGVWIDALQREYSVRES